VDGVRLTVRLGGTRDELDQVLVVDLADVVAAIAVTDVPMIWEWDLPGGATAQLQIAVHDADTR